MEAAEILRQFFRSGGNSATALVSVSGRSGLRWILPAQASNIARLLGAWRPYGVASQIGWGLIRTAAHAGLLHRLPGIQKCEFDVSATDWREFGWDGSEPPAFLADAREGKGKLVVKFPLVETAWPKIVREYSVLRELEKEERKVGPAPMHINHEKRFTVQSYIEGKPVALDVGEAHYSFLAGLLQPEKRFALEGVRVALVEKRRRLVECGALSPELLNLTERLLGQGNWQGAIPAMRIHGDFAPWNLKMRPDASVCAIDWEESESEGAPFYDLHYYQMQVERLLGHRVHIAWEAYGRSLGSTLGEWDERTMETTSLAACVHAILNMSGSEYGDT
jgi:hypothetical protein